MRLVNGKLVTRNDSLIPTSYLSNRSLLPSLTVPNLIKSSLQLRYYSLIYTLCEQGRFLVASRQLKAGSRIVTKLKPSVVGPPLTNPSNLELPLNFLKLKNSDPELFEKLLNLESHVEEVKESVMWPEYQKGIVEPLTKMDFDEDLVCQIIGIICTNSFELLQPTKGAPQHGLFEIASLMNHDCIGNTRYVQSY